MLRNSRSDLPLWLPFPAQQEWDTEGPGRLQTAPTLTLPALSQPGSWPATPAVFPPSSWAISAALPVLPTVCRIPIHSLSKPGLIMILPDQKPLLAPRYHQDQARPRIPGSCPACPSPPGLSALRGVRLNTWLLCKGSPRLPVPTLLLGMPSPPSQGCVSSIRQGTLENLMEWKLFPPADPKIRD